MRLCRGVGFPVIPLLFGSRFPFVPYYIADRFNFDAVHISQFKHCFWLTRLIGGHHQLIRNRHTDHHPTQFNRVSLLEKSVPELLDRLARDVMPRSLQQGPF